MRAFNPMLRVFAILLCLFATVSVHAGFQKIEDFEAPFGTVTPLGTVVPDFTDFDRHVGLIANGSVAGVDLTDAIQDDSVGTLFMRIIPVPSNAFVFGLTSDTAYDGMAPFSTVAQAALFHFPNPGLNFALNGNLLTNLETIWYNIWLVVDNNLDTTKVYLTTGNDVPEEDSPLQDASGVQEFDFLHPTSDPIHRLILNPYGGPAGSWQGIPIGLFVDDIYFDSGAINLANPVPEPTISVVVIGLGTSLMKRRSR